MRLAGYSYVGIKMCTSRVIIQKRTNCQIAVAATVTSWGHAQTVPQGQLWASVVATSVAFAAGTTTEVVTTSPQCDTLTWMGERIEFGTRSLWSLHGCGVFYGQTLLPFSPLLRSPEATFTYVGCPQRDNNAKRRLSLSRA